MRLHLLELRRALTQIALAGLCGEALLLGSLCFHRKLSLTIADNSSNYPKRSTACCNLGEQTRQQKNCLKNSTLNNTEVIINYK